MAHHFAARLVQTKRAVGEEERISEEATVTCNSVWCDAKVTFVGERILKHS
jgi:hypothetical protein